MARIISLIASATEIVYALGAGDELVGRSHECDYPESVKGLPVCTRPRLDVDADSRAIDEAVKEGARTSVSIYDVFDDVIERLEPTHIITQIQCEVCAVSLRDVEQALARGMKSRPEIVSLQPDSLEQIWTGMRRVAEALGIQKRGEETITQLQRRMKPMRARPSYRPRVACIEWIEPLMAAGNWTPELIEMAGGRNLFGEAGAHSPWMTWDELKAANPTVIVIAPCGFDLERTRREMHWLANRADWSELTAVKEGSVYLADGNQYFNRPGPRVVETLEILNEILWRESGAGYGRRPEFEGSGWMRFDNISAL
jgi:iron complex transport system substrate-binding protein